jgi:predicted Ser/Thr protein kinase
VEFPPSGDVLQSTMLEQFSARIPLWCIELETIFRQVPKELAPGRNSLAFSHRWRECRKKCDAGFRTFSGWW